MKQKKYQKIIKNGVKTSFKDGKLLESRVGKLIKYYKSLPKSKAIFVLSQYLKGIKREMRKHTLVVETSYPLSWAQVQQIKAIVAKKYHITKLETRINPQILGGARLIVGDEVYDDTIRAKIERIKEGFIS